MYPNPANETLNITADTDIRLTSIQIYNALGQLVRVMYNAKNVHSIDVSALPSGSYFIKIASDKGNSNAKFIKK
ncbi:T9SS type A sorting domain-containing protein [Flavobacterium anhuiense]|uniref:T9SS type A sorting domain-containing protein n=1 Tax=Flavobacterium anhuiense TaxID=459526 RepID=UPI00202656A5|nr:T9SS type A sorting domain-containing protein [Flavobacterium anhuiense]URM35718.1 T9SS type A sorting domain-containing protein [Flavobacterium anhuiense]